MNSAIRSLALVARQHGVDLSVDRLFHDYALDEGQETDLKLVAKIAKENHLKAKIIQSSWDELASLQSAYPVIARLKSGRCVVLARWNDKDDDAPEGPSVLNPVSSSNKVERIDQESFTQAWTGDLLLLKRNISILDEDHPFSHYWIVREFMNNKLIIFQLLYSSLLIHLFGFTPIIYTMTVLDKVVNYQSYSTLSVIVIGVIVAQVFNALFSYLKKYLSLFFVSKIETKINMLTFSTLINQPINFFHSRNSSETIKSVQQVSAVRRFLLDKFFGTILDATALIVFVPILIFYSPTLFLVVLVFAALIAANNIISTKRQKHAIRRVNVSDSQKQSLLMNAVTGIDTVKALNLEAVLNKSWEEYSTTSTLANLELGKMSARSSQISALLQQLMTVAVIFVGVLLVFDQQLTAGVLIGANMLAAKVTGPLVQLVGLSADLERYKTAIEHLGTVINRRSGARVQGIAPTLKGGITFHDVTFAYKDGDRPSLSNITFTIEPRQKVALVGASGSGKSSLIRLVQGLYRPSNGTISFEDYEIRTIDSGHLRLNISAVGQHNTFFAETIRENILRPMPKAPMQRLLWATQMVGLHDEIKELPDGYETKLEEGATNLSSGQRRKLALARALIRNPKILILDDALSGLSLSDEISIRRNMDEISSGRTLIMVTHHLSQIKSYDLILVLDDAGHLAEQGRHADLIQAGGIYANLWAQEKELYGDLGDDT